MVSSFLLFNRKRQSERTDLAAFYLNFKTQPGKSCPLQSRAGGGGKKWGFRFGARGRRSYFTVSQVRPQRCDSRWQITWLMIEIWQNNTMFDNSVPKQKYGRRKLSSASSPLRRSQRFSIKGPDHCVLPHHHPNPPHSSELTAKVTGLGSRLATLKNTCADRGHKSHADKF